VGEAGRRGEGGRGTPGLLACNRWRSGGLGWPRYAAAAAAAAAAVAACCCVSVYVCGVGVCGWVVSQSNAYHIADDG